MQTKEQYDVVVVGGGAAGFTAAYEASHRGLSVLVVEKGKTTGGSGEYIEGAFAVDSYLQKKHNVQLTKEDVLNEELNYSHYRADTQVWKEYIAASADMIKWLHDIGAEYLDVEPLGSGYRTWHLFKGLGKAVIHDVLEPKSKKQGTDVLTETSVTKVNLDKQGKVTSVNIENLADHSTKTVTTQAVVLATGGYLNNKEMIKNDTHYDDDQLIPVNSEKNTGDGLQLAWDAGAQKYAMGTAMLFGGYLKDHTKPGYVYRYSELNGAADQQSLLWVNENGDRFVNEEVVDNFALAGNALFTQGKVFTILDQSTIDHLTNDKLYKAMGTWDYHDTKLPHLQEEIDKALADDAPYITKADSIAELANKVGLADLEVTVTRYNQLSHDGQDLDFGKKSDFMIPVENGPVYAIELGIGAFCTMGGLKTDTKHNVLNRKGQPITGLYAIGNDGAGMLIGDTYGPNMPGTEAGFVFYSGKHVADIISDKIKG
ncbi:FAD-dependent oxidoreductase [Lactobacillus sp. ESL0791]|uniref:FAD-dependent oxidoreductase n=1 Tax=Lactobacillus sp. ESL0791 TaxID=2983234 RepID=UPI0023F8BCD0|nr:FAD-dependent oxidoreductase [Lactobacillus sp. ESL0791]MDF7638243.1 FAD-dependent oxidoreductase [Lactobacillus sp. ESL0791]